MRRFIRLRIFYSTKTHDTAMDEKENEIRFHLMKSLKDEDDASFEESFFEPMSYQSKSK